MHPFTPDAARALPGPAWLSARRAEAAERFASMGVPTPAAEEWRYSPIADFDLGAYVVAADGTGGDGGGGAEADGDSQPPHPADFEAAGVIDCVNGRIVSTESLEELAAAGVFVGPVSAAAGGVDLLGSVAEGAADYFTVLNDAFAPEPVVIDVADGVTVAAPVLVLNRTVGDKAASFPRLVVRVGADAEVRICDVQLSSGPVLVAPVVELDVGPAGRLGYLNVQGLSAGAWQIGSHLARVERDATLTAASAGLGGAYARTRTDARLVGRGASGDLLSLYFGSGSQMLDFRTYQDHAAPDTTSNLLYKGAVGDSSRSVYSGLIRVRPDARGTNAFQTNRNLKLSEDAWAESVPNLEIENNEVRCSHASAVGPIDPDQVFYLESRGVPTAAAERLIVAGFFDEVIGALPVAPAVPAIRADIARKLRRLERQEARP